MVVYTFIVLVSTFLMYYAQKHRGNILGKVNYIIVLALLILFGGLRNKSVGTDSGNYKGMYESYNNISFFEEKKSTIEIGFIYLIKICQLFTNEYYILFLSVSAIFTFLFLQLIKKHSYNYTISIFVFICLGIYMTYFNAQRQAIAIAFFSLSLFYVYHRKLFIYLIFIFIGYLFHKSILILLPFYFILNIKYDLRKFILILIVSSFTFVILGKFLVSSENDELARYANYVDRGATGGFMLGLFYTIISIILIIVRENMIKDKFELIEEYEFYLKLCLFSSFIYLIVIFTGSDVNFIRMTVYFSLGYILIWPIVFKYFSKIKKKYLLFSLIFIIVHLAFMYVLLAKMANLIPYSLNTEIF